MFSYNVPGVDLCFLGPCHEATGLGFRFLQLVVGFCVEVGVMFIVCYRHSFN